MSGNNQNIKKTAEQDGQVNAIGILSDLTDPHKYCQICGAPAKDSNEFNGKECTENEWHFCSQWTMEWIDGEAV